MGDRATDASPSLTDNMNTYINYTFMPPNRIKVDDAMKGENIYVAAKAKLTDEEGGPLINMKQVLGVVWYVAYLKVQRDAFAGIQGMDLRYVRDKALTAVADAKVPENISNNEWNQIMDAKVSFGRKTFNKDFKF